MKLQARAKLNLALNVKNRRDDGYHELDGIFVETELADELGICRNDSEEIIISCSDMSIPGESNLAFKAAKAVINRCGLKNGVTITLEKTVPKFAGLGGGSSDAAAVIKGMNSLFDLGLSYDEMVSVAETIGSDVPFFIRGGVARVRGTGEKIDCIENAGRFNAVIIKPDINISTAAAYAQIDEEKKAGEADINGLITALKERDLRGIRSCMGNVFEDVIKKDHPEIEEAVCLLADKGAFASQMSGSGSAVFGLFGDRVSAKLAYETIKSSGRYSEVFLTSTV